jgi:lipopolysaccharide/colanic/teichoic acid biosynthesis glycosyltransferase
MAKRIFGVFLPLLVLLFFLPVMALTAFLIKLTSKGPVIFKQKRIGKDGKAFTMYKFRTMYVGAEKDRLKYKKLNQVGRPVFKIRNDPRFVGIGRFLAHTGLDELPQIFNILKNEMAFVGPRPLPVYEYQKLKPWQKKRQAVLPGITSPWVVNGKHLISFDNWMKSDLDYIKKKSFIYDLKIIFKTLLMMLKLFYEH